MSMSIDACKPRGSGLYMLIWLWGGPVDPFGGQCVSARHDQSLAALGVVRSISWYHYLHLLTTKKGLCFRGETLHTLCLLNTKPLN
jgi:hypothetical protein